jgi:uncharacterized protein
MPSGVRFRLDDLSFTWDPAKAAANVTKHGISFEEAATTWLDRNAIERFDEAHSAAEERWLRIAYSLRGALLVAWSTERARSSGVVIRIIGARRAHRRERELCEKAREEGDRG